MIAAAHFKERERLSENLRHLMAERRQSIKATCRATGVSPKTLRSFLHGMARPQSRTLGKLAAGLGVPVETLTRDREAEEAAKARAALNNVEAALRYGLADLRSRRPLLFTGWTATDVARLFDTTLSRVG